MPVHRRCVELEARAGTRLQQAWLRVGSGHEVPVAGIAGVGHQYLVARLEQCGAHELQRCRCAGRDDDALGRYAQAEALRTTG